MRRIWIQVQAVSGKLSRSTSLIIWALDDGIECYRETIAINNASIIVVKGVYKRDNCASILLNLSLPLTTTMAPAEFSLRLQKGM